MAKFNAIDDKIIATLFKTVTKQRGQIILIDNEAKQPQVFGDVLSVGENTGDINVGDMILAHPMAGQDVIVDGQHYKIFKYSEVYCTIEDVDRLEVPSDV